MASGVEINSIEVQAVVDNHIILSVQLTVAGDDSIEAVGWLMSKLEEE